MNDAIEWAKKKECGAGSEAHMFCSVGLERQA